MSDVALKNVLDAQFRAQPAYHLTLFDRLPAEQQEALKDLTKDPDFYGVLLPRESSNANMKSVCRDTALLFMTLDQPGPLPAYVRTSLGEKCNQAVAELVLDGVLEIAHEGGFVCGPAAYDLIYGESPRAEAKGTLEQLAQAALEYAQALDIEDSVKLSARLYFYNRWPLSRRWRNRLPDKEAVADFLGIGSGGTNRRLLERRWKMVQLPPGFDGWFMFASRADQAPKGEARRRFKLYVSPQPEFVREAFDAVTQVLMACPAHHFKAGNDASGLLRPDKIVIYFQDFEALQQAAKEIRARLAGCQAQGVPFTAAIDTNDGLVSWGIDPPTEKAALPWQERESWRLWVTNRLATALLAARGTQATGLEPWRYALERLRLDKIDTATWTPLASFGQPAMTEE
jgi:hypothetical protein